jgi:CheY-like chemotaxis protein
MRTTIVLVEDDLGVRSLMEAILAESGYRTVALTRGDTAYDRIRQEQPDAVILDIQLERAVQGWTVLDLLRLDHTTAHIPVIICSADQPFLRQHGPELQAVGCCILEKPFTMDALLELVQQALAGPACRGT